MVKIANESVECRQQRLATQRQYEKGKIANESVECRQQRLANQHQYHKEKKHMNLSNVDNRDWQINVS